MNPETFQTLMERSNYLNFNYTDWKRSGKYFSKVNMEISCCKVHVLR